MSVWYLWPILNPFICTVKDHYYLEPHHSWHTHKTFLFSFMHQSIFCKLLLYPLSTQHYGELFICLSLPVYCKLFYSSLCPQYLPEPGTWLAYIKCSLNWTEQKISYSLNQHGFGPGIHAQTCSAVLDGRAKSKYPVDSVLREDLCG